MPFRELWASSICRRALSRQLGPSRARMRLAVVVLMAWLLSSWAPRRGELGLTELTGPPVREHDGDGEGAVGGGHVDAVHGDDVVERPGQRALDEELRRGR